MGDRLKPCPFCGSRNVRMHGMASLVVDCDDCGLYTSTGTGVEPEVLAALWNSRAKREDET